MKIFIIFILLNFVFCFSVAKADTPSTETSSQLEKTERAIWRIYNPYTTGTGFFIGPNHFITNFHVINLLLNQSSSEEMPRDQGQEDQNPIDRIILEQEGNPSSLRIKKVISVSALYDLALLETEESVTDYLSLREDPPEPGENLFSIAYPEGVFTKISKIGNSYYEDNQRYDFPVNHFFLYGASGAPVLDEQGQVVGMMSYGTDNLSATIKTNHLRELMKENIGIKCSKAVSLAFKFFNKVCVEKEMENLNRLAGEGYVHAQFKLATMYHSGQGNIQKDLKKAFEWDKKAAEQGHIPSQYRLAHMYYYANGIPPDWKEGFRLFEQAAQQGYLPARHELARMLYHGHGTPKDLNKALQLFEETAEQGDIHAQYNLAVMYYKGEGVRQNTHEAVRWLEKAAGNGFDQAKSLYFQITGQAFEKSEE